MFSSYGNHCECRLMFAGQDEQARENMRKERRRIQVRINSHLQYFGNTYCYFVTMHRL